MPARIFPFPGWQCRLRGRHRRAGDCERTGERAPWEEREAGDESRADREKGCWKGPLKRQARQRQPRRGSQQASSRPCRYWLEAASKPVAFPVWAQFRNEGEAANHKLSVLAVPGTPVPGRLAQEDGLSLVVRGQLGQWRDPISECRK